MIQGAMGVRIHLAKAPDDLGGTFFFVLDHGIRLKKRVVKCKSI
jgi:hypothetical protein